MRGRSIRAGFDSGADGVRQQPVRQRLLIHFVFRQQPRGFGPAGELSQGGPSFPLGQTLAYIQSGQQPGNHPKVAFIDACTSNTYCQAGLRGAKDASAKFGLTMKLYDSNFSSDTELKNAQDATQQGFDGYVFAPLTQTAGCSTLRLLKSAGKPVVNDNSPMCGNADYTPGTAGF